MCNVIIYVVTFIGLFCNQIQASANSRNVQKPDFNFDIVLVTFHDPALWKLISRRQIPNHESPKDVELDPGVHAIWHKPNSNLMKKKEQKRKIDLIGKELKNHISATNYIHREVMRIKNMGQMTDELLSALLYLEKSKNKKLVTEILEFYEKEKQKEDMTRVDVWGHKPNNNVIHKMNHRYG